MNNGVIVIFDDLKRLKNAGFKENLDGYHWYAKLLIGYRFIKWRMISNVVLDLKTCDQFWRSHM